MTRFARAKGSKASNERTPNDATPWHVMKEQLTETLVKQPTEKVKTAKELLRKEENPFYCDTIGDIKHDWAEFEETKPKKMNDNDGSVKKHSKKENKQSKQLKMQENQSVASDKTNGINEIHQEDNKKKGKAVQKRNIEHKDDIENNVVKTKNKKHKEEKNMSIRTDVSEAELNDSITEAKDNKRKEKKRNRNQETTETVNESTDSPKKKKFDRSENSETTRDESSVLKDDSQNNENTENVQGKLSKRQKRNMRKKNKNLNEDGNTTSEIFNATGNDWDASVKQEKDKDFKKSNHDDKAETAESKNDGTSDNRNDRTMQGFRKNPMNRPSNFTKHDKFGSAFKYNNQNNKRKPPKVRDDKEHKRRKPDVGSTKITINGVEVDIVKYDGFPVRKEDAERLKDLKQKMIMKGIPKVEVDAAMKLERRKAEKALARLRKCVCFHCRKSGHNLSDCPELGAEQAGTGICFKCGSTEHTHFECKVVKATEYRYASCFICREQGHIAKQCPDNPKGVYPQGGACKICGDVTHLKKDCPDLAKEKEEATITVDTITNGALESLEKDSMNVSKQSSTTSKSKVVKF